MSDLDLLDLLSDKEKQDLSEKTRQAERKKALAKKQRKLDRMAGLDELGLLEETTTEWVAVETVTFWRQWHCTCGETYQGPAYDTNPTFARLEKMRVRYFSPQEGKFLDFKTPRPMKKPQSAYRHAGYQMNVPHRTELLETQLWSCPACKTKPVTTVAMQRPCAPLPLDDVFDLDESQSKKEPPSQSIPTYGEISLGNPQALIEAYESMGLDPNGDS